MKTVIPKPPLDRFTTKIGKYSILVKSGKKASLAYFSDIGDCAFWTCVLRNLARDYFNFNKEKRVIIGRAKVGLSAGDRFDRMRYERKALYIPKEDRPIYEYMWKDMMEEGYNVDYIRPSTLTEVKRWFTTHQKEFEKLMELIVNNNYALLGTKQEKRIV
jgi:hypothetical protein